MDGRCAEDIHWENSWSASLFPFATAHMSRKDLVSLPLYPWPCDQGETLSLRDTGDDDDDSKRSFALCRRDSRSAISCCKSCVLAFVVMEALW